MNKRLEAALEALDDDCQRQAQDRKGSTCVSWINYTRDQRLEAMRAALYAADAVDGEQGNDLGSKLQQKCSDWGTYWRAPDAHGVNLSLTQALELLRDALGVEVAVDLTMFNRAIDIAHCTPLTKEERGEMFELRNIIRNTSA